MKGVDDEKGQKSEQRHGRGTQIMSREGCMCLVYGNDPVKYASNLHVGKHIKMFYLWNRESEFFCPLKILEK